MRPLLSPQQMTAADAAAIASGASVDVLMERAGRAVARAAIGLAGGRYGRRAVVMCGKGNNGGDGFVAARVLAAEGLGVRCIVVGLDEVSGTASDKLDALRNAGITPELFGVARFSTRSCDVVVDALYGTGFHGIAERQAADAIEAINQAGCPVVAVDIPSGLDGLTGTAEGPVVTADVTVAMAAEKLGTALATVAGEVVVADIGIPVDGASVHMTELEDVRRVLPVRAADLHKGSAGSVAIMAGSRAMTGAAALCARAAGRTGAGYVRLGTVSAVKQVVGHGLPEVLVHDLGDEWAAEAWDDFASQVKSSDVLAVGPGMGQGDGHAALIDRALGAEVPLVLDADGLNNIAGDDRALRGRTGATILTPHPGEMGRLLGIPTEQVQADRLGAARGASERFGAVVLLKGARSVIADPSGCAVVDPAGGPVLATAGSGDVLTGVIAAFVAAGMEPFEAAWAGCYLHGTAGRLVAARAGSAGAVAWDFAEALPEAMRSFTRS
jgi:NAD(P)H-hydrate epimerase